MTEFETIYKQYFEDVYKFSLSLSRNVEIAQEITQETFFKALKSINHFDGKCKMSVWLCQIAKNTYFSFCKSDKRNVGEINGEYEGEDFETQIFDKETAKQLHLLLHAMDEPYKEVFTLRVFGELHFGHIAELFGKSESWARVTFHRAKKKLKEEMQ